MTSTRTSEQAPTLSTMVGGVATDLSSLMKDQIALTKSELRTAAQRAAVSSGLLVAAAFVAVLAVIFLLVTIAYALVAAGLPVWAGFGIVTLVLLILTAVLALVGYRRLQSVRGPERSIKALQQVPELLPGHADH
jgi:fatty acid desaturase